MKSGADFATRRRNAELALIHVGKKTLGLDDETYRAMLMTLAGVTSAAELDAHGRARTIEHMKTCGFNIPRRRRRDPVDEVKAALRVEPGETRQEALIAALWDELKSRGALRVRDASLEAFMKRMGIAVTHPRFLDAVQANKVIEALKDWLRRADRKAKAP